MDSRLEREGGRSGRSKKEDRRRTQGEGRREGQRMREGWRGGNLLLLPLTITCNLFCLRTPLLGKQRKNIHDLSLYGHFPIIFQ